MMLGIGNIAIVQKNNTQTDGQKFQQSPFISYANPILKHDSVSFGAKKLELSPELKAEIETFSLDFFKSLLIGTKREVAALIKRVEQKTPSYQEAFFLHKGEEGNSPLGLVIKHRAEVFPELKGVIEGLEEEGIKQRIILFRNDLGDTHFTLALKEKQPRIADDVLGFAERIQNNQIRKKFVLSRDVRDNNQFNVAVQHGYIEHACRFLDLASSTKGTTPSKFFLLMNKDEQFAFQVAQGSCNMKLIEKFDKFRKTSVSDEYIRKRAAAKVEKEMNPFAAASMEDVAAHRLMTREDFEALLENCSHRPLEEFKAEDRAAA